jgi:hypothetical protein
MKITRELALQILKYCHEHKDFYFPFLVMCKEYTPEDDDFVEVEFGEWELILEDESYQTFELWENLNDLRGDTTELLAKVFIEKITNKQKPVLSFIFYTAEGLTFQPNSYSDDGEVENCQILGWAKGYNPKDALMNLKIENPWIEESEFKEVIASELKNEKTYYFNLK